MSDVIKGLQTLLATAQHVLSHPVLTPAAKSERLSALREDAAHWLEFVDEYDPTEHAKALALIVQIDGVGVDLPSVGVPRRSTGDRLRAID